MNEDRVVTIEKKATNKVGLFFLLIFVLAGLGYATYYYINNKNLIVFENGLPWEDKETEEETQEDNNTNKKKTVNKEGPITREKIDIELSDSNYRGNDYTLSVINTELINNGYNIRLKLSNSNYDENSTVTLRIKEVKVNNFQISQNFTIQASPNQEVTYDLSLPANILDKNRIYRINDIIFIAEENLNGETNNIIINIPILGETNDNPIESVTKIATVNKNVRINYYKKQEESNNTKIYFLINNEDEEEYDLYIDRLEVNNKDVDVSKYPSSHVYSNSKYINTIDLEKSLLNQNEKIKISFILISSNKSIYKTIFKEINI